MESLAFLQALSLDSVWDGIRVFVVCDQKLASALADEGRGGGGIDFAHKPVCFVAAPLSVSGILSFKLI